MIYYAKAYLYILLLVEAVETECETTSPHPIEGNECRNYKFVATYLLRSNFTVIIRVYHTRNYRVQ